MTTHANTAPTHLRETQPPTRVIVIGGAGESGRRIVGFLRRTRPELALTAAGRSPSAGAALPEGVTWLSLDVEDEPLALERLRGFDLAILALGPTERYGARPHRLCIAAGVDCIDINDSLKAADAIHALHPEAERAGRVVYTGMGLTPGLSTLLLMRLAAAQASPMGVYRARLYMGAAYGGGPSSPHAILASFERRLSRLVGGERRDVSTPWRDLRSTFQFRGQPAPLPLVPFASPEIAGLASPRYRRPDAPVLEWDSRYHIQFLSPSMARAFAHAPGRRWLNATLARQFYEGGQKMKRRKSADPDTCLCVYPDDEPTAGLVIHGAVSSYDLTALMTCAVVDGWLDDTLPHTPGVFPVELLPADAREALSAALARRGVSARPAPSPAAALELGWVQPVTGSTETLCHHGDNWYTARPMHPRMAALQKEYLVRSRLWRQLREQLGPTRFALFVVRVLNDWRRDHARLAVHRRAGGIFPAVTRDVSMFTSGYGNLRRSLGRERAYELYREMFLDTGAMEMRWLWPAPEVFAALPDPAAAVSDYWLAFMRSCAACGLVQGTERRIEARRHEYVVQECAYARMFEALGCPELSGLIREMEQRALAEIARGSGLVVDWIAGERGQATIRLTAPEVQGTGDARAA